jgi:predicted nuclease of predicted toxin-antitoxin system
MNFVVDMNLSPALCDALIAHGWNAIHWSAVGDPRAADDVILSWAAENGYIVLTHDLDFGAILAATQAHGPSVVQVRTDDVLPSSLAPVLIPAIESLKKELEEGALVSVDEAQARVRLLPLARKPR